MIYVQSRFCFDYFLSLKPFLGNFEVIISYRKVSFIYLIIFLLLSSKYAVSCFAHANRKIDLWFQLDSNLRFQQTERLLHMDVWFSYKSRLSHGVTSCEAR